MDDFNYAKDSRREKKREAASRNHHDWCRKKGAEVIIRSKLVKTKTSFEAEDAFDVSCDGVAHSLNKGKRWEKVRNAQEILREGGSSVKTTFIKSSIPRAGTYFWDADATIADSSSLRGNRGGVKQIIEVEDGDISVRNAKSQRATIEGLQSTCSPLKKSDRHRPKKATKNTSAAGLGPCSAVERETISEAEEVEHTVYSALEIRNSKPTDVERAWRAHQSRATNKGKWTRKQAADVELDRNSDSQNALEYDLDAYYDEQLESEQPLKLPEKMGIEMSTLKRDSTKEQNAQKQKEKIAEAEKEREGQVKFRPTLKHDNEKEIREKAKEWFDKKKTADSLPIFPRTLIIHSTESDAILGVWLNRCTLVAESTIAGQIDLYAAPERFFFRGYQSLLAETMNGWSSHVKNENEYLMVGQNAPTLNSVPFDCPICKGTEGNDGSDIANLERSRLCSFKCGHIACDKCWISHVRALARASEPAITCVNSKCKVTLSICETSAIFSDETIELFRELRWNSLRAKEGAICCYYCERLLVPHQFCYKAAALCSCGRRICRTCGSADHLPLSCKDIKRWREMRRREDYANHRRHLNCMEPYRKYYGTACELCRTKNTMVWKDWYAKWCDQLTILPEDPIDTRQNLAAVFEPRTKFYHREYREILEERRKLGFGLRNDHILDGIINDQVALFENITIRRLLKCDRHLKKKLNKADKEKIERMERKLKNPLFAALEAGGDLLKNAEVLRLTVESIQDTYNQYM